MKVNEMALETEYDKQWLQTALRKGNDGKIALVTDDRVNPRELKRFREALRKAKLFDADNSVGLSEGEVKKLWISRKEAWNTRPGREALTRAGGGTSTRWATKERSLTKAQEDRLKTVFYRDLRAGACEIARDSSRDSSREFPPAKSRAILNRTLYWVPRTGHFIRFRETGHFMGSCRPSIILSAAPDTL